MHSVKFRPGGLTSLTGHAARDLRDATVPATTVFPPTTCDALRELGPGTTPEECRAAFDAALRELRDEPETDYLVVLDVITTMLEDRTLIRVAQVEERCDIGTRSAAAPLREVRRGQPQVGALPLPDARRRHRLDEGYDGPLADLAAEHGWFDQAHFTREFTDLVGVPPSGYVAGAAPQR